ncbi:MAG TPA: malic enzyme-like NAD(P)-binding protein [Bryobacteraceae bacterium]|nr:malic enzyme-like NAD(P)-binding protein [Bryobacteraceae bacterium]
MDTRWWPRAHHSVLSILTVARFRSHSATTCTYFLPWGLAVVASRAQRVTEPMMLTAAHTLGANSPALKDPSGSLLPPLKDMRRVRDIDQLTPSLASEIEMEF